MQTNKGSRISCPHCASKNTRKHTKRKNKQQTVQIYYCKDCYKYFSDSTRRLANKTHPSKIILNAISTYNLGCTQEQTAKEMAKRSKINVPQRTISEWINKYKPICTYHKLRKKAIKLYKPDNLVFSKRLEHNQIYNFQCHKAKLELLFKDIRYNNEFRNNSKYYEPIKNYLEKIPTKQFPHHIFQPKPEKQQQERELEELSRSSQIKFKTLDFIKAEKQSLANKLAQLALNLAKSNKDRHSAIQNFFLINDSTTIATEVPVYLTKDDILYFKNKGFTLNLENYNTPITGHIDILQIRNGLIHILDYKPEAKNQNPIEQLTIYALALASRTKLDVHSFKCAWFDENNYYEFYPLHAVYKKQKV